MQVEMSKWIWTCESI